MNQHPMQVELTRRYMSSRQAWAASAGVREAAEQMGMSEREYCDQYLMSLFAEPLFWTGTATAPVHQALDYDRAFAEAQP